MRILVINPGGTSTKVAVYDDQKEIFRDTAHHTGDELKHFATVFDEYPFRVGIVKEMLEKNSIKLESIDAVSGRGGLMKPIVGGTYPVNEVMIQDMKDTIHGEHASNLGCVIARKIADEIGVEAFVVDPVSVDEQISIARITGLKEIDKKSWYHALNHKAVSRKIAEELGRKYEECNFIVAHLGSGLSIVAHKRGKMIDGSGGRSDGPFSPERCGGLLSYQLIELCFSGKYTREELVKKISGYAGMYDYLGTKDMVEITNRYNNGDREARDVLDAFIYQVSKEISRFGASLYGEVDAIILTGGISFSDLVVQGITRRVKYLAEVKVIPGEMEIEALAAGALRVLRGEEEAKEYM